MKTLKKLLTLAALVLFAMMFTSCKAKIGGGEFSIFWQILAILMWFIAISQFEYIIPKKQGVFKWICHKFFLVLFLAGIIFPFIWAPLPYIPKISLGVAAFIWLIGMIKGAPIKKQKELEELAAIKAKAKAEAEEKERAEAEEKAAKEKAKAEAEAKAAAEAKAKEEAIEAAKKKLADEKAAKLAETQAALSQLENDLAAKKAQVASLGLDAQGIVQKAKLNKEIKDLEPQIETLKAEVEKLSK